MTETNSLPRRVAILGGGKFGYVLARLVSKNVDELLLWLPDPREADRLETSPVVELWGKEESLPDNVTVVSGLQMFQQGSWTLLVAVPSQGIERLLEPLANRMDRSGNHRIIFFTKGILSPTLRRKYRVTTYCEMLESLAAANGYKSFVCGAISGPALLPEIHSGMTGYFVLGLRNTDRFREIAPLLESDRIQVSVTDDLTGVEICGILKSPIALACGIAAGLPSTGDNLMGELVMTGFQEMRKLALALGVRDETIMGRAGLGELISISISDRSRNRIYGKDFVDKLLSGSDNPGLFQRIHLLMNPSHYIEKEVMQGHNLAEGVFAVTGLLELAKEKGIPVPLYQSIYRILTRKENPESLGGISFSAPAKKSQVSNPPVAQRKKGISHAAGHNFTSVLEKRIMHGLESSGGLSVRVERQASQIISILEKRLADGEDFKGDSGPEDMRKEKGLWVEYLNADENARRDALRSLIQFYISEISDHYQPGVREALLKVIRPFRSALGGFRPHSAIPWLGGYVEEVKSLASRYNILYAPTHKSHLDSVEVAFGLSYLGLPVPRYAAGKVLMSTPSRAWLLKSLGAYAVDRQRTRNILYLDCLRQYSTLLLEAGIPSLVFPEGTRSRTGSIAPVKTGLLSTAVEAYQNTGSEIVVVPITLSYESVPEDTVFSGLANSTAISSFVTGRHRVYMDFGEPIHVSRHMKHDSPALSIAYSISRAWETGMRILPIHLCSRILSDSSEESVSVELFQTMVQEFLATHSGNFETRDLKKIQEIGLRALQKKESVEVRGDTIRILKRPMLEYYGNMVPGTPTEDPDELQGTM